MPRRAATPVRLSLPQIVAVATTVLGLLVSVLGAWYDLKRDVAVTRNTVELSTAALAGRIERLERSRR